ncbi:hypothetical protein [Pseudophaeobacter sp.]|uniref:hypothetical protein n=1 Tax=Pseudophaeobacter sp. TaxID=1971739 RepID=UPI004058FC17
MLDIKDATTDDFAALEGQSFCISGLDADISLVLSEVKILGSGERKGGAFSTLWQGPTRLCCTNPCRDSLHESSMIAGRHEQLAPHKVQNHELVGLQ